MGYGASAKGKRALFTASRIHAKERDNPGPSVLNEYKHATIDVAAVYRKVVPFDLGADTSVMTAVRTMFMPIIHQFSGLKVIVLCFDSPDFIPEVRKTFHVQRRYVAHDKPPKPGERRCEADGRNYTEDKYPVDDAQIEALTMSHTPCPWPKFWNSSRGKAKLWSTIQDCIKYVLQYEGGARRGVQYIIDTVENKRWCFPAPIRPISMPPTTYGEGDLKSIAWANHFSEDSPAPVLLMTIDWDVILALLLYNSAIHVWIGTVYVEEAQFGAMTWFAEESMQLTRRGGIKIWGQSKIQQTLEIMEIPRLIQVGGEPLSRLERQHLLMLSLCAGGVDYCYGLKDYGFSESDMIELVKKHRAQRFRVQFLKNKYDPDHPLERHLEFNPGAFLSVIECAWNANKCKHVLLDEFIHEIHNILFCVCYFGGYDSQRKPGGPLPPTPDMGLFGFEPQTMTVLFRMVRKCPDPSRLFPPIILSETHPHTTLETLGHHPSVSYDGDQLERIVEKYM